MKVISIDDFYHLIVIGGAPFNSSFRARMQARDFEAVREEATPGASSKGKQALGSLTSERPPLAFLTLGSSSPALSVSAALPRWTSASGFAAYYVFLSVPRGIRTVERWTAWLLGETLMYEELLLESRCLTT